MSLMERGAVGNGNFVLRTIGLLDTKRESEVSILPDSRYPKQALCGDKPPYMNLSNLSFFALQTGQISGGSFRAQR